VDSSRGPTRPSSETQCAECGGTGYVRTDRGVYRCECQRRKIIAQKLQEIPERFRESTFANYVPIDARQEQALERVASDFTRAYFLFGDYARGKTHLATAQYKKLIEIERPCMFLSMAELIAELRRAEMDFDYFCTVRQRVRYTERFHLFVDDIDKYKSTDFKFEVLFDLFDTIYKRQLGLTVTSNCSLRELVSSQTVHASIVRRIDDTCQVVEV
jgi:DNA replication protein DnaC